MANNIAIFSSLCYPITFPLEHRNIVAEIGMVLSFSILDYV